MKFTKILLATLISGIVLGWGTFANAQSGHYSAASLSMGATGTAYLDTYHANFLNPANLMLNSETKPPTSIGILGGVSATAGGPLLNISAYNNHFTSGNAVDVQSALNSWFGSAAGNIKRMGLEFDVVPLAGSWRGEKMGFSLALRNRVMFSGAMNRAYAEALLSGITQERFGNPTPVNFSTEVTAFSEISAGFSYEVAEIPSLGFGENIKIYAGIAPKYIIPHATSSIDFNSTLQVTDNEIIHDFKYTFQTVGGLTDQFENYYQASQADNFDGSIGDFVEPEGSDFSTVSGSGFGVDLGTTVEMDLSGGLEQAFSWIGGDKKLRVGLSINDIGSVKYTQKAGSFTADETFTWDGFDVDDGFNEALTDSIANQIYLNYEPGNKKEISQSLPTKVNLGGHLKLGKLGFALDLTKGLNEVGMNSKRLAVGVGAEYTFFNFLPLRVGYRTGGLTSSSITVGTGLEFRNFEFTVGALTVPNSQNRGTGIGTAWSGLVFRF